MAQVQELIQTLQKLPPALLQEVADFAAFIAQRRPLASGALEPTAQELALRRQEGFGRFAGLIEIPEDFDAPLDDFKEYT